MQNKYALGVGDRARVEMLNIQEKKQQWQKEFMIARSWLQDTEDLYVCTFWMLLVWSLEKRNWLFSQFFLLCQRFPTIPVGNLSSVGMDSGNS